MVVGDVVRVMNKSSNLYGCYGVMTLVSSRDGYHGVRLDGDMESTPFARRELAIVTPKLLKAGEWVSVTTGALAGRDGVVLTLSASGESALVEIGGRIGKVWMNLNNLTHSLYLARCGDDREAPHSAEFEMIWQRVVGGGGGGFGVGVKVRVAEDIPGEGRLVGRMGVIIKGAKTQQCWCVALEGDAKTDEHIFFEDELEVVAVKEGAE